MKKQRGFSLIGVLLIIGALVVTAGGVVVWEKKVTLTATPVPNPTPTLTSEPTKTKYLSNESYCEKDSDCTTRPSCCNSCYKNYVNIYHKDPIPQEQCSGMCKQDCPPPSRFGPPVCRNNKCTSSTASVSCQSSADCPPSLGVCGAGNCPSWRCINSRCVYFKDVLDFESCLEICLEVGSVEECYKEFGQ